MRDLPVGARALVRALPALIVAGCGGSSGVTPPPPQPPTLTNAIVFVSDRSGIDQIYVMNGSDGSNVRQLTMTDDQKHNPVVSPDGRRIAYASGIIVLGGASSICVINSDGTGFKAISGGPWADFSPTWSPDGKQIAFVSLRDGNSEIYLMNADGSGQTNLTKESVFDVDPSWSPTGDSILFVSGRAGSMPHIYSMSSTGVSSDTLIEGEDPEWSPSGARFLFVRSSQVFVSATPNGSSVKDIAPTLVARGTPRWSPDERRIAIAVDGQPGEEIWTVNSADGSNVLRLTTPADGSNFDPSWTRH